MEEIQIGDKGLRLGQLLKLAGIADTGGNAKGLLSAGLVMLNGEVEQRRGAQLKPGDVVQVGERALRLV